MANTYAKLKANLDLLQDWHHVSAASSAGKRRTRCARPGGADAPLCEPLGPLAARPQSACSACALNTPPPLAPRARTGLEPRQKLYLGTSGQPATFADARLYDYWTRKMLPELVWIDQGDAGPSYEERRNATIWDMGNK